MDKEGTTYTVRTVDKHERSLNSSHDNATSITRSSIPPQTTATTQPQIHSSTTTSPTISPTFATLYRSASSYRAHVSGTPQYVQTSPAQVVRSSSFDSHLPIFSHIPSTNITHANTLSSPSLSPNHAYFLSSTPTQFLSTSIPTIQYSSSPNYCPIPNTTFSHVPLFVSTQPVTVVPSNIQKPNISKKKVKTPSSPVASSSSSSSQSSQHLQIVSQEHPSAQERKRSISPAFGEQVKLTPPEKKTKTIEIPKSTQALKIPRAEIAEAKQHSKDSLKGKKTIVARFLCPNNCEIQGTPIVSLDSSSHSVIIQGVSLVYNPPEFAQLDKTVVVKGENGSLEVRLPLLE
ncbi:predicted protein [Naegleria gruberi]|uniref:Predicted protein n=1 Tax=Naegleria gruberi TaxID=5762 RepID=D2VX68_NAEGR|nr:uncharacterized protein NAEGRDRAFT_73638 [Naegleria gruberi]EFC38574.1 predicted protein [Naegleria gruberi]|eukprot:XP_002671318.1 predicted protein [Naegleria gruberi strain NEG-M]